MRKEKRDLLVFGYGLALILIFVAWRMGKHGGSVAGINTLTLISAVMIIITLLRLPVLKMIYRYWMIGAHFIGNILTSVVLIILFYLVFTPVGIVIKILGKDLLDEKLDSQTGSHWHTLEQKPFDKRHFHRQF